MDVLESTPRALPITWLPVPRDALQVTFDRIFRNFWLRMRAPHPSKGTPKGLGDVWWRHFRRKGPTWADIAQFPHARTPPFQVNPLGVTWLSVMSHPLAMSVMRNGTFCTTIIVRKKCGGKSGHAQAITSGHVTSRSGHVTSGDVTSGSTSSHLLKCGFGCPYILLSCLLWKLPYWLID